VRFIQRYGSRTISALAVIAVATLVGACASAQTGAGSATIPAELVGIWDLASVPCAGQGNPDSDTRLVIAASGIDNYEQTFAPVEAVRVSDGPRAWRIRSNLRFEGESREYQALYVLARDGRLTIVDDNRTEVYGRCR